jgi:hemerythrin-like domain-containing protein
MRMTIIRSLTKDHEIMQAILSMIRLQIELLSADFDENQFKFLRNAMVYMSLYPGAAHHPSEELIFEILIKRRPGINSICEDLIRQHKLFRSIETEIVNELDFFKNGDTDAFSRIKVRGAYYCEEHIWHVDLEDKVIFPAAVDKLGSTDWSNVSEKIDLESSPSNNVNIFKNYGTLYDFIMESDLSLKRH